MTLQLTDPPTKRQLHDLVLDHCQTQYTPDELRAAHRAVVEAFRAHRPTKANGLRQWDLLQMDDQLTFYCIHEIEHHVEASLEGSAPGGWLMHWMMDCPQVRRE